MNSVKLSIVVPTYNESDRIERTLDDLTGYLSKKDFKWEIIVSDDGSTDDTLCLVDSWINSSQIFTNGEIRKFSLPHKGKGSAIKVGMLEAEGELRFMCDADFAMSADQIDDFLINMEKGYDIVIGSREITGATRLNEPLTRHLMGKIFNFLVSFIVVKGFRDTQCGYKCFTSASAKTLFGAQKLNGWSFDVEILMLARKRDMKIYEMPIVWHHRDKSKVSAISASVEMIRDTILTKIRYISGDYSDF